MPNLPFTICFLIAILFQSAPSLARTVEVSQSDDWVGWLTSKTLRAGDELIFREGVYSDRRRLAIRHSGSSGKPIVIRSAAGEQVVFRRPDAKQNTFNLEGCQFLVLRGFEITGGSAAIRIGPDSAGRQASDIVLEDLHIHHIGGVAVTCNFEGADYRRMLFRRNHIHHTSGHGEAFYLGANDGKATFAESVIELNYIHHLNGKRVRQGDGIEIKQGSFGNRISGNVIHDTGYPAIMVYGTEGRERNVIQANLIWNTVDHGIQAAADAIIRDNFIAGSGGCGIYSRKHQSAVPGNLRIEHNHIVAGKNPAVRLIGSDERAAGIELLHNTLIGRRGRLIVRIDDIGKLRAQKNRGVGDIQGSPDVLASWTTAKNVHVELPDLKDHPAWQFLKRSDVLAGFESP